MILLSIDGGGMRGIIPALVLAEIERITKKNMFELVRVAGGTSTGGILACAVAAGVPMDDAVDFYIKDGPNIFKTSLFDRITNPFNLNDPQYPSKGLQEALRKRFGDATLSQAKTGLIVTSYDIDARETVFFKSWRARSYEERNFLLRDLALATASAPTYFAPARTSSMSGKTLCAVDGGVFANNPSMCVLAEGLKQEGDLGKITLLSLGTGKRDKPYPCSEAEEWGLVQWVRPLLDVMFDGQTDAVDHHCALLLENRYIRMQKTLTSEIEMDDASKKAIDELLRIGAELINENKTAIRAFCDLALAEAGQA